MGDVVQGALGRMGGGIKGSRRGSGKLTTEQEHQLTPGGGLKLDGSSELSCPSWEKGPVIFVGDHNGHVSIQDWSTIMFSCV